MVVSDAVVPPIFKPSKAVSKVGPSAISRMMAATADLQRHLRNRILTVNGVSKAYAMTGWRFGYGGGPAPLMKAVRAVISQSTSRTCSIAQAAAAEAPNRPQDAVRRYRGEYRKRREPIMAELSAIPRLSYNPPDGTFYAFVDWRGYVGRKTPAGRILTDDESLCDYLLRECGVAVIPGSSFGSPGYFRISFASAEAALREGMSRIRTGCAALS